MKVIGQLKWIIFAVCILIINALFGQYHQLTEQIYYNSIFRMIRIIYDYTLGWLPFPMVYLLFLFVVYLLYRILGEIGKGIKGRNISKALLPVLNTASFIIIFFYLLWGFNYQRDRLSEKLQLDGDKMSLEELIEEGKLVGELAATYRMSIIQDTFSISGSNIIPSNLESQIRMSQKEILNSWDYQPVGRVRVRKLMPKGILLRLSTAGVYIPYVAEGHIDKGLHPIQWPFTMAHEMAHGYGFTDEGECNFIAFVTCMNAEDPVIQYSAILAYFRYIISNLRLTDYEAYIKLLHTVDRGIMNDIYAINKQLNKYPDIMPDFRDLVYDSYLKSHGVHEGLRSYSTIIRLVNKWKKSKVNADLVTHIFPSSTHE